jgi:hypothetical protein
MDEINKKEHGAKQSKEKRMRISVVVAVMMVFQLCIIQAEYLHFRKKEVSLYCTPFIYTSIIQSKGSGGGGRVPLLILILIPLLISLL